jgi:hypothetical protein
MKLKKIGSCKILRKFGANAYEIELSKHVGISPIFNISCLYPYDAGASSTKCKWKKTQHPSTHFEVTLNLRGHVMQIFENIVIKEHLKCLEVEPSHEIDGDCISFNVVVGSIDLKHSLLSFCINHLL